MEKAYFLDFFLQNSLEAAERLFFLPSPEEKPFENKYKSREILENLLKDPFFLSDPLPEDFLSISAFISYQLALNFLETEENSQGEKFLLKALSQFSLVSDEKMNDFLNVLQDIYNNLGFIYVNREEIEMGMGCLAKAEELYQVVKTIPVDCFTNSSSFLEKQIKKLDENEKTTKNDKNDEKPNKLTFFSKQGLNTRRSESLYTLTQFYMAQAFTKLSHKEKAAFYCGNTMKRQYENKEFVLKEFCINCISLSEYYQNNENFAQGYYLLQAGVSLIPYQKRKKLNATFSMCLARLFSEFMQFSIKTLINEEKPDFSKVFQLINKKSLIFETLPVEFVLLEVSKNYDEILKVFRLANTQYKKALGFFVLDGYVTEYVEMQQEISQMIKSLAVLETDAGRSLALLQKRREILEPILKEINPKAYPAFSQVF